VAQDRDAKSDRYAKGVDYRESRELSQWGLGQIPQRKLDLVLHSYS